MKKNIVVFSGAGLDRESGVLTFRDCEDGLWNNHKIDDVATPQGWFKNCGVVLDFYNQRRRELKSVVPNDAHLTLVKLEENFNVTHVTQNVSDLLERAGATNVIHLHGELTKARTSIGMRNPNIVKEQIPIDIGYKDIDVGDTDENGGQLRPHIVWFEEYPFKFYESYEALIEADILIIVGTSLRIGYTIDLLRGVGKDAKIYYVDPDPSKDLDRYGMTIDYRTKTAVEGITEIYNELISE